MQAKLIASDMRTLAKLIIHPGVPIAIRPVPDAITIPAIWGRIENL
jgi:hypothetical protein